MCSAEWVPRCFRGEDPHEPVTCLGVGGEGGADVGECAVDGGCEGLHGSDGAETDQGRNERILNQVLTGFVVDQIVEQIFEVLHVVRSPVKNPVVVERPLG